MEKPQLVCVAFIFISTTCLSKADAAQHLDLELIHEEPILEEVITTGKMPRVLSEVAGAITLIDSDDIASQLVGNIADLVRYESGISVGNQGSRFGYSGYAIRGIGGNRVAIEVDGMPVAEQFSIGRYSNSGRNLVDPDLVKQVEILRGPASSLYGSDAIGGVVSYTTFSAEDLIGKTGGVYSGFKNTWQGVSDSQTLSYLAAAGSSNSSFLISVKAERGHEMENQAVEAVGQDFQDNESRAIQFKYAYRPDSNRKLTLAYESFEREALTDINSFIGQGRFVSTTALQGDDNSARSNYSLTYDFGRDDGVWLNGGVLLAYRQSSNTEQLTDETRVERGVNYLYDRDFFYEQELDGFRLNLYGDVKTGRLRHRIGYGLEISEARTRERRDGLQTNLDQNTSTNIILSEEFPLRDFPITETSRRGLYLNDEISFAQTAWALIAGARIDSYALKPEVDAMYLEDNPDTNVVSIDAEGVSPKLGLLYRFDSSSKAYLQYVHGYRAPPFEDANIGLYIPLFGLRAIPNPDLKSESSDGYEVGIDTQQGNHRIGLLAFYNDYDDFIQTKVNLGVDPDSGLTIFQSQNIERAKIVGTEFRYRYSWENIFSNSSSLDAWFNCFWSKGENKETSLGLNSVEPAQVVAGLSWRRYQSGLSLDIYVTGVAAKKDYDDSLAGAFVPPGYTLLDLIFNYEMNDSLSLGFGLFNVTNKKYWRWSDVSGLVVDDPLIEALSSAGTNGSFNLRIRW